MAVVREVVQNAARVRVDKADFAHLVAHAHHVGEVPKTYSVRAEGQFPEHILAKLRKGVEIDGVLTRRSKVKLLEQGEKEARLSVTITEGRNRQVRRMFEAVERNVVFLKRVAIGELKLGGLARGGWRYLHDDEVEYLKSL